MFDTSWIADLDATSACEAILGTQQELREQEVRELRLAAHWAVLHGVDSVPVRVGPVLPGTERVKQLGGDGTPGVAEFACAELGMLMGTGFVAADRLMRDALDLQHRHPLLWDSLAQGRGRVWKARKVAALVHAAGLSLDQARAVDAATTPYVDSLSWGAFLRLVEAKVIEADPEAAEARRLAREMELFVSTGQCDEHGLKTLIARAEAGDVIVFVAMCDRIAELLAAEGDTAPVDVRRARAVGVLGNPARALALLQRHAVPDTALTAGRGAARRARLRDVRRARGTCARPDGPRPAPSPGRPARADQRGGAAFWPRRRGRRPRDRPGDPGPGRRAAGALPGHGPARPGHPAPASRRRLRDPHRHARGAPADQAVERLPVDRLGHPRRRRRPHRSLRPPPRRRRTGPDPVWTTSGRWSGSATGSRPTAGAGDTDNPAPGSTCGGPRTATGSASTAPAPTPSAATPTQAASDAPSGRLAAGVRVRRARRRRLTTTRAPARLGA